ncbi:biopolymer transport protein ExbD [Roseimicrobium gellanilyticum]|uniref:Biopolymer transport protein ExbD n=2 Tax=Roseimicrobium gellanilyticum TaxID=748857 RepID=A0A366HVL9_9BACT|nr:biopolymer transport protein ExbD [Roseimicrobium gellanilyticum]
MGGGGGSMESGEPEFQIAPMIDCLLVLLIFFMSITTASVLQIDKDIVLPVAPDAKKPEKAKVQEGAINVKWDAKAQKGVFSFEGVTYDDTAVLVERLKERLETIKGYRLIIRGDSRLPAVEIQKTMNILANAGYSDLSFSALNQ